MRHPGPLELAICALCALSAPVAAADFSDPTWPCIQRKVEGLSVGLMWPAPIPDTAPEGDDARAMADLAATLALRRVDEAQMRERIDAYASEHPADMDAMGLVFQRVFDRLAQRRGKIMGGIEDFSLSQIALAERIDTARDDMDSGMEAEAPDFDRIDALEEQIAWDERIYTDRQKSLVYLCETPVLLEKRLYAIARMLQDAAGG